MDFAVGATGAILESSDAGATWKPVTLNPPTTSNLYSVSAHGNVTIAVGDNGTILRLAK